MQTLDDVVSEIGKRIINRAPEIERAKIVYDWMLQHIRYDSWRKRAIDDDLTSGKPLRPEETLLNGKGICSDLAVLYVAISRRLDLPAFYAYVDRDEKNQPITHAIAIIDLPKQELQVDPALRIFDAHHLSYYLEEPDALKGQAQQPAIPYSPHSYQKQKPFGQKLLTPFAAFALCGTAWLMYALTASPRTPKNITYLETENTARFITKYGDVRFAIDADAKASWKEALFFTEALNGDAQDPDLLDALLSADKDGDNTIRKEEAEDARALARGKYIREKQ